MRRAIARPQQSVCQLCSWLSARPLASSAKASWKFQAEPSRTSNYAQNGSFAGRISARRLTTAAAGRSTPIAAAPSTQRPAIETTELPDLALLSAVVNQSKTRFLSTDGIPSEQLTIAALRTCSRAATTIQPYIGTASSRSGAGAVAGVGAIAASNLLSLDSQGPVSNGSRSSGSGSRSGSGTAHPPGAPTTVEEVVNSISDAAFAIIAQPAVLITPRVLELYVDTQTRLGKPETLPTVFSMFASKPKPQMVQGSIHYAQRNPNRAAAAIEASVSERALKAALDAKNLDVAIAVVDLCYASPAFTRQKLLRKGMMPVATFLLTPAAAYLLATMMSSLQNMIDPGTATRVAFIGLTFYVGITAAMGTVATMTANDHMRRVTWAPGIPLRERWLKEEERLALDKVACTWGFKEKWRWGEEIGGEWEALREYCGMKGMVLDRVELMEGMN
jgi:hypothetical protein